MAVNLKELKPQKISKNLKGKFIMLYGLPGIGKTKLASLFPNVIIAGFEMGTNALNNVYVQPIKTWNDWKQMVGQLCRDAELQEQFECVAIDTADSAWDLCVKYICSREGVEKLGDIPWGAGYDMAKKEFHNTFRDLSFSGFGLVFISHSSEKTFKDEKGEEYQQINPALPQRPYDIVNKMVDLIGYIREIEQEDGTSKRYIFFRSTKYFFAKSRFSKIEPKIEFGYDNIVNAIYNAIDQEVEGSGGGEASNEENPYLELDFDDLMKEAGNLWAKATEQEKNGQVLEILQKTFGRSIRFSEIVADEVDKLNIALMEIRDIL